MGLMWILTEFLTPGNFVGDNTNACKLIKRQENINQAMHGVNVRILYVIYFFKKETRPMSNFRRLVFGFLCTLLGSPAVSFSVQHVSIQRNLDSSTVSLPVNFRLRASQRSHQFSLTMAQQPTPEVQQSAQRSDLAKSRRGLLLQALSAVCIAAWTPTNVHAARDLTDDKFVGPGKDRNKIQVSSLQFMIIVIFPDDL
jgi:hypothetical protein